ncbi:hypothetical protein V5L09_003915 [Enterobacter hormaechei]
MTETVKTNVIKEPSLIVPKRLTAHKIIVKTTGEVIEITNDHRITYGHLEDQFRGLTNPENIAKGKATGHFYGSNENLAIQCGVSEYTFKKVKKDLKALGLIDWKTPKAKKSGHACEYFVKQLTDIAHNLEFIYQELSNGQPSYDHARISGLKTKKTKKAAQPKIEESGNGVQQQNHEQSATDDPETAAPVTGKPDGIPALDIPVDVDLFGSDDASLSDQPEKGSNDNGRPAWFRAPFKGNGDLVPEAKAWARSRGATSEEEEKHEIWRALEIITPLLDSQSEPELQPSDPSTAADEEESEEEFDAPF